jgi:hypothetical protein
MYDEAVPNRGQVANLDTIVEDLSKPAAEEDRISMSSFAVVIR